MVYDMFVSLGDVMLTLRYTNRHSDGSHGPGLKMYFLLKMGIFYCYVGLPEGRFDFGVPALSFEGLSPTNATE